MLNDNQRRLLTRARAKIKSGSTPYICHALGSVALTFEDERDVNVLKHYIRLALKEGSGEWCACTLQDWQYFHHIHHDRFQQRQDRLAWIDWMLEGA